MLLQTCKLQLVINRSSTATCATVCPFWRRSHRRLFTENAPAEKIASPAVEGVEKTYDAKIHHLVDEIGKLTLLEVASLNELLKKTLNIQDAPMMTMAAAASPGLAPQEEEEEAIPQKEKTAFTVKLLKFDDSKKVQLIKELKNVMEGMNLVQAKKFVESAPQTVKADIGKDEAEKLAETLKAVGAVVEVD